MLDLKWRCCANARLTPAVDGVNLTLDEQHIHLLSGSAFVVQEALRLNEGVPCHDHVAPSNGITPDPIQHLVQHLHRHGLLVVDLRCRGRRLATLHPLSVDFDPLELKTCGTMRAARWSLSRFALLRRDGDRLLLECSEAQCYVALKDPRLVQWVLDPTGSEVPRPDTGMAAALALLADLGFANPPDDEEEPTRRMWEFHDRYFHRRTRHYPDPRPFGATYRFRKRHRGECVDPVPRPPPIRPSHAGKSIVLPVPENVVGSSLAAVMERRRSRRGESGLEPVQVEEVAALLYRVARVTARPDENRLQRPYPSGGGAHELEFYVAVRVCRGLEPGFYHYRSDRHMLTHLARDSAGRAAQAMVKECAVAWAAPRTPPQCLVVISSRLPRLAWKYAAIAYRVSLLNAGVALQSLYLVATDIGLSACASACGNPDLFEDATGVPSWEETSIAEFGFGSGPASA